MSLPPSVLAAIMPRHTVSRLQALHVGGYAEICALRHNLAKGNRRFRMKLMAKWGWLGLVAFGLVLVVSGLYMIYEGKSARDDVTASLSDERIVGAQNTDIGNEKVTGPEEAKAQA